MSAAGDEVELQPADRHVVLVGMMGSGKSSVGRAVAERLGRQFADIDELIEAASGGSVRKFFATRGEAEFREAEAVLLDAALAVTERSVIGGGGGIVTHPVSRRLLCDGRAFVVWLRARPKVLLERLQGVSDRPLLDGGAEQALPRLLLERSGWYAEVADLVIDTDEATPGEVADEIVTIGHLEARA